MALSATIAKSDGDGMDSTLGHLPKMSKACFPEKGSLGVVPYPRPPLTP